MLINLVVYLNCIFACLDREHTEREQPFSNEINTSSHTQTSQLIDSTNLGPVEWKVIYPQQGNPLAMWWVFPKINNVMTKLELYCTNLLFSWLIEKLPILKKIVLSQALVKLYIVSTTTFSKLPRQKKLFSLSQISFSSNWLCSEV